MIPESWGDNKPNAATIGGWIRTDRFQDQAEALDNQVRQELESRLVQEKIEMLSRHANLGMEVQDIAIDYIRGHRDELTSNAAVRLLIEGVRIERESKGIPQALEKMINKTDEELLEEVKKLTDGANVEIEVLDD